VINYIKELFKRKELIKYLVIFDISEEHRGKIFGFAWSLLDPLIMMFVYILFVGVIFKRGTPKYPILLLSALLSWQWITNSLSTAVTSVTANAKLIQTFKFPIAVFPFTRAISGFIDYIFGLVILIPLLIAYEANLNLNILWFPFLILIQLTLTVGLCFLVAYLGVYFRDIRNILQYLLRICFFLSPVLYAINDRIPVCYQPLYMLNPFAALFESYKNILVRGKFPSGYLAYTLLFSISIFIIGLYIFVKHEEKFAKDI